VFVYGCLMHNPPSEPSIAYFDKIQHAGAFIVLGAWFAAVLRPRYAWVLVGLSIFAAGTEVLQWCTSYRDGDPLDWLADTTGACLGLLLVRSGAMNWLYAVDRLVTSTGNNAR